MESPHWKRNLYVCVWGSFVNIVAMTLLLPFLPLYVERLGVEGHAAVVQWSGVAYGCTFLAAALVAPIWGKVSDRYGCKPNLVRASFGMTLAMCLTGLATNIWQLVGARVLIGLAGGYTSGSYMIVAAQTPKDRSAWALGVLASGITAGSLIGPLVGGVLPSFMGIRYTFFLASACISLNFAATCIFIKEDRAQSAKARAGKGSGALWSVIYDRKIVISMLLTAGLFMVANMSIEPIIAVYVRELLTEPDRVTFVSGLAMSIAALGTILSSPRLGKIADAIGAMKVVVACLAVSALLLIPQAFVTEAWQLVALRFLMGLSLGGLLPSLTSLIRHNVPDNVVGRILGYSTSAQYAGQVVGPVLGGFIGGHVGMRYVFLSTSVLLFASAAYNWLIALPAKSRGSYAGSDRRS